MNPIFSGLGTTIFTVMSALSAKHGAVNLGQGFPDEDGPTAIRDVAAKALREGPNQYPPMQGLPALRAAIAAHDKRFYGAALDPETQVLVTSGATEALADCFLALAGPGDEAVIIEPAYDAYKPILEAVGATVRSVRLAPPDFRLTEAALAAAFHARTKLIAVNSPLNPVGRVFDSQERELIARFVRRFDAYAVCDDVYEHLVFDGRDHVPLCTLPGMAERCVRVGSAGKMFSLTGWKVGWVTGPAALMRAVINAHQFTTFTTSPALQLGIAYALENEMEFTLELTRALQAKRDFLGEALRRLGFGVSRSEGTYFLAADISNLTHESDRDFCERLTRDAGVAAIPLSPFYGVDGPQTLIRFAFCKKQEVLEEAVQRLERHFAPVPAK